MQKHDFIGYTILTLGLHGYSPLGRVSTNTIFVIITLHCSTLFAASDSLNFRFGLYAGLTQKYPQTQGVMWSDRVVVEVFKASGIHTNLEEFPARRLALALEQNLIDGYLSSAETMQSGLHKDTFLPSGLPLSVITWFIYYDHRSNWVPVWPPDELFLSKSGKSKQSSESLKTIWHLDIGMSPSSDSIASMVNSGRLDYWIDNITGIRTLAQSPLKSEEQGFTYEPLFDRPLIIYFQDTHRGKQFRAAFNTKFKALLRSGKYRATYHANDSASGNSQSVNQTIRYYGENYPNVEFNDN